MLKIKSLSPEAFAIDWALNQGDPDGNYPKCFRCKSPAMRVVDINGEWFILHCHWPKCDVPYTDNGQVLNALNVLDHVLLNYPRLPEYGVVEKVVSFQ